MVKQSDKKEIRAKFLEGISQAYSVRRKNIILLTGDVNGLFWLQNRPLTSPVKRMMFFRLTL